MSFFSRDSVIKDMNEAADRMGLEIEDLQEMIVDVLEDCQNKAQLILKAIEAGDIAQIKSIAHDIKGSSANYGLMQPSGLALQIEKKCEDPSVTEPAEQLLAQFNELLTFNLDED